ncbi:MAG: undecaprenyldiphospho-muramoylpentapeptide beta-N-acetylglucosaminyltransferase [Rickettsiaceae bacterium]
MKNRTILLAAGGTGGHLFPAVAVAEELSKIAPLASSLVLDKVNYKTHLITDLRCKNYLPENLPAQVHIIDIHLKMSGVLNKALSLWNLSKACIKALFLVKKLKPSVVVGFGGYPSFPVLLAAKILKVPIILHEQNCFLGKSNRFFAKTAKVIALSYKETTNINSHTRSKIIITGDIVRPAIENLTAQYQHDSKVFNLFAFGGSQGAKVFSKLIPEALKVLRDLEPNLKIKIVQQVGLEDHARLEAYYNAIGIEHELANFFHNMAEIYSKTQLVIARSGASTIAELVHAGVPAIFIPYPLAMDDHQYFNAKAIADSGAGWCYRQENLTAEILAQKLQTLITNRKELLAASKNLTKRKKKGAAKYLADTVVKIIN